MGTDATYYDVGFGEFMSWLQSHADTISSGNQAQPWSFGEFGVGTDLEHAERFTPATAEQLPTFITQREAVFSNLFAWMQNEAPKSGYSRTINLWVVAIYDPVGIFVMPGVVVDPVIQKQIRDYTDWRCHSGGIESMSRRQELRRDLTLMLLSRDMFDAHANFSIH